jgi:hypothetical protein
VCPKHRKKLIVFIFLLCAIPLFAQAERPENDGGQFTQRLSWDADPNVFKYEVIIERESGGVVERRVTADSHIAVSLLPDRYRYTVDVYNLLDVFEYRMAAVSFEVLAALQPVVTGWTPNVFTLADENNEVILSGANLVEGAFINLVKNGTRGSQAVSAEIQILGDGSSARILLPPNEIKNGTWTIYITNPGGLSAVAPGFRVKSGKRINFDLSVLYSPLMPVRSKNNSPFGLSIFPAGNVLFETLLIHDFYQGVGLKLAWLPIRTSLINIGFLLEPYLADLTTDLGYATTSPFLASASLSLVLQTFLLKNHLALHISTGVGIFGLFDFYIYSNVGSDFGYDFLFQPYLDIGVSIKIYPSKSLFIELGASWNITYPFDNPDAQYIKPQVGIGYSF